MRKFTTALALVIMALIVLPAAHADTINVYVSTTTGGASGYSLLGSYTGCTVPSSCSASFSNAGGVTGLSIDLRVADNVPGGGSSITTDSQNTITYINNGIGAPSSTTFYLLEVASPYNAPVGGQVLTGKTSINQIYSGTISAQNAGLYNVGFDGSGTLTYGCRADSGTVTSDVSGSDSSTGSVNCTAASPFNLANLTTISLSNGGSVQLQESATLAPEPASMLLLGTGLFGLAGVVRRKYRG